MILKFSLNKYPQWLVKKYLLVFLDVKRICFLAYKLLGNTYYSKCFNVVGKLVRTMNEVAKM